MTYASRSGRARTSQSNPQAFAVCDRCGIWYNHSSLQWQMDWRGASLQNIRLLVCQDCYDTPQEQQRAIVVPADPTPIINARIEAFEQDESDFRSLSAPLTTDPVTGIPVPNVNQRIVQDGTYRTTEVYGAPQGLTQNAQMPLLGTVHLNRALPVTSVSSNGTDVITVTCSRSHGLATNDQIAALGLSDVRVNGFFSVTVTTATVFTYQTVPAITAQPLLTGTARIATVLTGLPYGYVQIPQIANTADAVVLSGDAILQENDYYLLTEAGYFLLQG